MKNMIDAHIHLDHYQEDQIKEIAENSSFLDALISVSFHLESCKQNKQLTEQFPIVKAAFGFHPEQPLPSEKQLDELLRWMAANQNEMVAVGEVGLPYYSRQKQTVTPKQFDQYIELLEVFIKQAIEWDKPIVLHAVYEDSRAACDLLERHSFRKAHFHWFKGDSKTVQRMARNGYFISVTPDVVYEEEIQKLVRAYPLQQIMVETDGPWPFEGPFKGKMTHPEMMVHSIKKIARLRNLTEEECFNAILMNTKAFYCL